MKITDGPLESIRIQAVRTVQAKKLTDAQQAEFDRIARGVEFVDSLPAWKLIHSGMAVLTTHEGKRYIRLTTQALVMIAKGP